MSEGIDRARELLRARLTEIEEERSRLERALAGLRGKKRGPGRPRKSDRPGRRRRSS